MGTYRGRRARAVALARRRQPPSLVAWLVLALIVLASVAAHAQTAPGGATDGHTAPPPIAQPASPAAPGGAAISHGNGVITPPTSVDPGMPVARPNPTEFPTPNVRPPAPLGGGDQKVVPK